MTVGTSLFIFAVGAILKWAVTAHVHGFNLQEAGVILMVIGAIGFVASVMYMLLWHDGVRRRTDAVDRAAVDQPVVVREQYPTYR